MMHRSLPWWLPLFVLWFAAVGAHGVEQPYPNVVAAESEEITTTEPTPSIPAPVIPSGPAEAALGEEPAAPSPETAVPEAPLPAPSVPAAIPAPITSVEVAGNENIPTEDILAVIGSKVGLGYSEEQVAQDRKAVLALGWFKTVAVERESLESGIRLVFRTSENPVVTDIQFEGIRELTRDELLAVMETKPGAVYNLPRLRRDWDAMEALYHSKGFILAQVEMPRMTQEGVLRLSIAEGEIEAIEIRGNTRTKTHAIRRYLRTKVGDTYNEAKLARDIAQLMSLGWFETVNRDADAGEEWGKAVVIINVVEKRKSGEATFGGGYSSVEGFVGFVDVSKGNLFGTGQMASVRAEFGGRTSYELGYRHPWIMTPETRMNVGLYNRLILREALVTPEEGGQQTVLYDEHRRGGNITFGRPLSDRTTVYLSLRRDDLSISDLDETEQAFLAGTTFQPSSVRSLSLAATTDTRDNRYNPRKGAFRQLSAEFAGIFGGVDFTKYSADFRRYFRISADSVVAMRLLGGTVTGDAPYLEQFLIGGSETLRGYRSDRFVGARMVVLNTEYRFPVTENLLGVVFVDLGDAWGGSVADDPFVLGDASFDANLGYGAGIRVRTPIGPLRLDLGFSEEGTETHFGLSHMF
jgi:outer membrane protein insertion porin family